MWCEDPISPFGLVIRSEHPGDDVSVIATSHLRERIQQHRVLILRGFAQLNGDAFPAFCKQFGSILEWDFGTVNDLRVKADTKNYLYTNHEVPFHWDGAFLPRAPHYIFFHCDLAPLSASGGETLFCDTTRVMAQAPAELRKLWEDIVITYTTEKIVHYGGTFTSPMITTHPISGDLTLRYAEPVADLNPVRLMVQGLVDMDQSEFIEDMRERLNDENCCNTHSWLPGDLVIADNYTLLHGRRAFSPGVERHIRRVNVI